jgi:riboflavin synthase alpha subunit
MFTGIVEEVGEVVDARSPDSEFALRRCWRRRSSETASRSTASI